MAHVQPLPAHRPEFADTQPDLRTRLKATEPSALALLEREAKPLLVGVGIGSALVLTVVALRSKRRPPPFTLFPISKPSLVASLVKAALFAAGRTLIKRSLARAVERVATQPA